MEERRQKRRKVNSFVMLKAFFVLPISQQMSSKVCSSNAVDSTKLKLPNWKQQVDLLEEVRRLQRPVQQARFTARLWTLGGAQFKMQD